MVEAPVLEDTDRTSGRDALRRNILSAMAVAGAVRSTLGPFGLDKLLVDQEGHSTVTNDGMTVLDEARIEHPTALRLVEASRTVGRSVADGTTSTVLLSAEMLANAWNLIGRGVHPAAIVQGFSEALGLAKRELETMSLPRDEMTMALTVATSMAGKGDDALRALVGRLASEAAKRVIDPKTGMARPDHVRVIGRTGGRIGDTDLVPGLVLSKHRIDPNTPARLKGGRIMLVDGGIEPRSPSSDGHLRITDPTMLEAFRARSREQLEDLIVRIASQGVNLLVVREGIDDLAVAPLREAGIVAYRRVDRSDLDLLARATGAKVVHDPRTVNTDDFGAFDSSDAMDIGGRMHWILRAEHGRGATLFIRGSTEEVLDEVERCFDDALGVATGLVSEGTAVPGAGATHIAIARHLRREASRVEGRSQLAVEAWADALEVIPRALSENAGRDPIDDLLAINAAQASASGPAHHCSMDLRTGAIVDVVELGILDPTSVIEMSLSAATDAAVSVLRVDDVLWAQKDPTVPEEVEERLAEASNPS